MANQKSVEPLTVGWYTTDAAEIELRRQRGAEEPMEVKDVTLKEGFYGDFEVVSEGSGQCYLVEIRALDRLDNSCTCTDFRHNDLGTCKHIEATLLHLQYRQKKAFNKAAAAGSPMVEIFLKRSSQGPHVTVTWPREGLNQRLRREIAAFFDDRGRLRDDPVNAIPALQCIVERAAGALRISAEVDDLAAQLRRQHDRKTAREIFLSDVARGQRSMNILKARLYPYQQDGMLHLAFGERTLLADEMGLGKTIQAIAACELLRRIRGVQRVLIVAPASLKSEWEEQIRRFSDQTLQIVYGLRPDRLQQYGNDTFYHICNYEQVRSDVKELNRIMNPDIVVLDEAQRIKNWASKTARHIKRLTAPYAFVLTGTPLENRIDEVYSIVDFLDPSIFGPLFRFNREFYRLDERGRPQEASNLSELHNRLRPIMLRRRKDEVEEQLPERTIRHFYVKMAPEQKGRHDEYLDMVARLANIAKRRPLLREEWLRLQKFLACMRMICDSPYILDKECRISPKLDELKLLLEPILTEEKSKIIIFSEWERMLELVRGELDKLGQAYAWHTGSVPQKARRDEINRFKNDPDCRIFLSTDSGATGLNLQCASVVINLDLPWNPARLEQRIARAWRKHQNNKVRVFNLVALESIEEKMIEKLELKRLLAAGVIDGAAGVESIAVGNSQRAMLERLTEILEVKPTERGRAEAENAEAAPPPDPTELLRDQLVASQGSRLRQITRHTGPEIGSLPFVMAVVQGGGDEVRSATAAAVDLEKATLEVIDEATYDVIKRLVAAGVLQFTGTAPEVLYDESESEDDCARELERRKTAAKPYVEHAARQLKMAKLLVGNDFMEEALAPLKTAAGQALRGALVMAAGEKEAERPELTSELVTTQLLPQGYASAGAFAILLNLLESKKNSRELAQNSHDAIEQLLVGIADFGPPTQ